MSSLRLVSALLLVGACAADPSADQFDPGGGGKADDSCASDAYGTWLREYLPKLGQLGLPLTEQGLAAARTLAESKPCTTGSDADYALWHGQYAIALEPVLERYNAFARSAMIWTRAQYDQALAAAMPSDAERRTLEAYVLAKPDTTGAAGYKVWLDGYVPVFRDAFTGAATTTEVFEANAVINAADEQVLALVERARPETSAEAGYAVWFGEYYPWLDKGFAPTAEPSYRGYAERFLESRPGSAHDVDYLTFFEAFYPDEARAYAPASERTLARIDALATARPGDAGGMRSFKPWFNLFVTRLGEVLGDDLVVSADETARMDRLITVKPCSTNPEDATRYAEIEAHRAQLGAAGAALLDRAKPTACE